MAEGANTPPWDRKYFVPIHYVIDHSVSTQDYTKHLIKELLFSFFRKLLQGKALECSIGDRGLPLRKEETLFRLFFFIPKTGKKTSLTELNIQSVALPGHNSIMEKRCIYTVKTADWDSCPQKHRGAGIEWISNCFWRWALVGGGVKLSWTPPGWVVVRDSWERLGKGEEGDPTRPP